jgi:hypothetical protein
MTMFRLLGTCFSVSACSLAQSASNQLEGCPDPAKVALALKVLQNRMWANLSFDSVEKVWPTSLRGGGSCEPHCSLLVNDGRVIRDEIECGVSFHFETSPTTDGSLKTRLNSLTIKYSTRTREDRDAVERTLIGALHMGDDVKEDSGVETGTGRFRDITWTDYEPEHRSCDLALPHGRVNKRWELIFILSCGPEARPLSVK